MDNKPIFTLSTGKTIDTDRIKFDLLAHPSKGTIWLIFQDGAEMYLSAAEWRELLTRQEAWRQAGMYDGTYDDSTFTPPQDHKYGT